MRREAKMPDETIRAGQAMPLFAQREAWFLAAVTVIGGLARLLFHADRPFVGDEVGTLMYAGKSVSFILTHFESWLTMNYFILLEKMLGQWSGNSQISLVILPLAAGILTIPLTAVLARKLAPPPVALIAAALVAANPYLFQYSGVIRAYALLTALSLGTIILFLVWRENRTLKNGLYVALAATVLVLSHPNGLYVLAAIVLIAAVEHLWVFRHRTGTGLHTLFIPLLGGALLLFAAYVRLVPAISLWGIPYHESPPTTLNYVPYVIGQYLGAGYFGWPSIALFLLGALLTCKRDGTLLMLVPFLILPSLLMSVMGLAHFPWAFARFLIFLLPIVIIFVAEGARAAGSLLRKPNLASGVIAAVVLVTWIPGFQNVVRAKVDYPWNRAAAFVLSAAKPGDVIIYWSPDESLNLYPYLGHTSHVQSPLESISQEVQPAPGGRLFLVRSAPFVSSMYPSQAFGEIQVIVYPATSYSGELTAIRDDVLTSITRGTVAPELTDDYRDLWEIERKLGSDDAAAFRYYQMYTLSLQLTDRQRNMPLSLQNYLKEQTVSQDVLSGP